MSTPLIAVIVAKEKPWTGSHFNAWTRRRFGLAAGGIGASLLAPVATAAKKKKKKCKLRCRDLLHTCTPGAKNDACCPGLNCDLVALQSGLRCCLGLRDTCAPDSGQCCRGLLCENVPGLGNRCCSNGGDPCSAAADCCFGAPCTGGQCEVASDRALKANFATVDPADMLDRVRDLPISTWNYTRDDPGIRHIGPMAQDFGAAFGVGADDRHIHPLDGQGVALAAIQGLAVALERLREENAALAARLASLEPPPG